MRTTLQPLHSSVQGQAPHNNIHLHTYRLGLSDDEGKAAYINYCLYQSDVETGVVPEVNDRVLTLSTCTGHGHHSRCVVQAVLDVEFFETEAERDAE